MSKKRILYIHHGGTQGGAPLSLLSLLNYLDRSSYEPIVCSSENDVEVLNFFDKSGYKTCTCRLKRFAHTTGGSYNLLKPSGWCQLLNWYLDYPAGKLRLKELLQNMQPDIVHFNSLTLAPYAQVSAKMGLPSIVHVRESVLKGTFGFRRRWLTHHLNRYTDQVIAVCFDNLERLQLIVGKGQVIYNPIDFKKFDATIDKQKMRSALGITIDAKIALFGGGSVPNAKGLKEFITAMGRVRKQEPCTVCLMPSFIQPLSPYNRVWTLKRRVGWLLGIYKKQDRMYKLIEQGGLLECIVKSEFTNKIEYWIAASDVVCAPHILPHFSRTVIEAGAMKKPVVAFQIGGINEVVTHLGNGLLVEIGDVAGLAAAIEELFSNQNLCKRLGENGWHQAQRLFAAENIAKQISAVYEEMLSVSDKG
jgi:glycosyltransferase involved in cell wall biosynthesis